MTWWFGLAEDAVVGQGGLGAAYQGGRGSLWFRLPMSEPSERVNWMRRWRDCSRTLIWSGVGVAILMAACRAGRECWMVVGGGGGELELKLGWTPSLIRQYRSCMLPRRFLGRLVFVVRMTGTISYGLPFGHSKYSMLNKAGF